MRSGPEQNYCRLQVRYVGRLGVPVGIFVAVDHLRRAGRLSDADEETYFDIDDWFNAELPDPPFYQDGNSIQAVTWFKAESAGAMLIRLDALRRILRRYDVPYDFVHSTDPGRIVYEDHYQIGVIPYERAEPTPTPPGLELGPTTAGSKRHLARKVQDHRR
jgi:hypothetical protein